MIIVTGGAGMIGSNIIKALNEQGINDILVVDNLKNGKKFQNLVDLDIADYMDRDDFLVQIMSGENLAKILKYLSTSNLLSDYQYGFHKGHFTGDLAFLTNSWSSSLSCSS